MGNKLYKKNNSVSEDIRDPFGYAKDRSVTPQGAPTSIARDRVGSHTDAPARSLPQDSTVLPGKIIPGTPLQPDGTILAKLPSNVKPGPDSMPYWRRDIKTVPNNEQQAVLTISVPPGKVFRIERLGHTFWNTLDEFWVVYDGKQLNNTRWSFPLGTPVTPYQLRVTVSAVEKIECWVYNRSGQDRLYEFFLDGYYDVIEYQSGSRTE
jgi:hypothetical protein